MEVWGAIGIVVSVICFIGPDMTGGNLQNAVEGNSQNISHKAVSICLKHTKTEYWNRGTASYPSSISF
jgi:uncharacterized membrane protein YjfL (UPF0719 family)